MKESNASGGKGLIAEPALLGKHQPRIEGDNLMETKLNRLTEIAKGNPKAEFTSLAYLLNEDFLKACYEELKKRTATGIDRVTVEEYGLNLDANISNLVTRMKAKAYRPQPARRAYIPKPGTKERRPLGVPSTEDRIVQRGISKILSAIYEGRFLDSSFGFRPNRNAHQALDRINKAIMFKPVRWVADMDIEQFFDSVNHHWMMECLQQRIKDSSLLRLIARFLIAGVMEEGQYLATDIGTPQGGNLSPTLSNIFLHYVLDLWFERIIKPSLKGYAQLTRFADDYIVVFEREEEAKAFETQLRERLAKFGLKVKESKSKIVEFGRKAWERSRRDGNKMATFDFLGFTHFCDTARNGNFKLGRKTKSKKLKEKLKNLNLWMKAVRSQAPLKEWWPVLKAKLLGHYRYYGVSGNSRELWTYHGKATEMAFKWINRRSQKRSYTWPSFLGLLKWNPLPQPKIYHNLYAHT
jgi:group II intron reverse transcriptase/maturase